MFKILSPATLLDEYRKLSQKHLADAGKAEISTEEQQQELSHLKETIKYERFFFVVNMKEVKLQEVHGIERWLGYKNEEFTFLKYLSLIHPAHAIAHGFTSIKLIEGLMRGDWPIEFMKHRFVTQMALRHKNGNYILFKRLACIFQYDENKKLFEFINEFTIDKTFNGEPYTVRTTLAETEQEKWFNEFLKRTQEEFKQKSIFGFQEMRILRKYAYNENISVSEIANSFKIQSSTVITYNKRILEKAEDAWSKRFDSAKQVALKLRDEGLV